MSVPIIFSNGIINVCFGENVKLVEPVNLYGCSIGNKNIDSPGVYAGNLAKKIK